MPWKRYALPALLAGIALSTSLAQTSDTQPPAHGREHGNSWQHGSRHPVHHSRHHSHESA